MDNIDRKALAAKQMGITYGKYEVYLQKNKVGLSEVRLDRENKDVEFIQYTDGKRIYYVQPARKKIRATILSEPIRLGVGGWRLYKRPGYPKYFTNTYAAQFILNKIAKENKWKVWWD